LLHIASTGWYNQ